MPSYNHGQPIPDLFEDDDTVATQLNGQSEPEQEFAFAPSAPPPPRKSKKKSRKNANKAPPRPPADETEDGPYGSSVTPPFPASVTPSPPKDDGVKLDEGLLTGPEPPPAVEDNAVFEELVDKAPPPPERVPSPPPAPVRSARPARVPSPEPASLPSVPARSPRQAQVKPIQAARTPPSRPASLYSPPQQYSSLGGYRPNSSTANPHANPHPPLPRRESATHTSPRPRFVEPVAPPHKMQPHFYGLPDFGLNFGQQKLDQAGSGKAAGSDGYCCIFDSFADSGDAVSGKKAKDALLVGSEGGLEVFRVLPNKFEVVGRLEGLRGSVIGAKVLPHVQREDSMQRLRPLVAVVVHGAMVDEGKEAGAEDEPPGYYQTSVEVYSLQEQSHVATLYRSSPVAVEKPTLGHLASVPGAVGDLRITAEGRFVVVASGKSGEVFAFSNAATAENPNDEFRCLGKFWTSLQISPVTAASRPQSSSEGGQSVEEKEERAGVPIFSLSQRWLALMAPATSSHVSIGGSPTLLDRNPTPPGLATHVASPQPPISCDIAGVDAEGTWGRLTRQAAQGLVKYSHIGFEMGRQGWRELTHPAPQSTGQHSRGASREHEAFPPTMAPMDDPSRVVKEPAIVSIIDFDTLLEAEELKPKYPSPPLSTFALQEGCNFLSLSSNGLRLLSVSRSGKVSTIWDLAQSCHGTARLGVGLPEDETTAQGPCVKQLHRFERNSESIVADATWSRDDDMLAVLTSHGTVHLHEVPLRPSRKRKRRSTNASSLASPAPPPTTEKAQPTVSVSQGMSPPSSNGWMGSIKSGFQSVSTQVNTVRTQTSGGIPSFYRPTFAGFREITANAGQAGGRAIAKGLSQGYTAAKGGVGDYWHAEDNKIRHAALRETSGGGGGGSVGVSVGMGVMRWVRRSGGSSLAVVCAGTVHLHPVQGHTRRRGEEVVTGLKHDRYGKKTFALPLIRTAGEAAVGGIGAKRDVCASEGVHGFWSLRVSAAMEDRNRHAQATGLAPPAQQANEVETNPPYCPFHVDPRVSICAFDDALAESQVNLLGHTVSEDAALFHIQGHGLSSEDGGEEEPWIFGAPLPASVKLNSSHDEHLPAGGGGGYGYGEATDSEDELMNQVQSRLTLHGEDEVRVHTRPKAGKGGAAGGREEEAWEEPELFDEDGL